jgi:hemerythrin-like metal-binding protein
MDFIIWKDQYSVGIDKIDDQHKKLIKILNELYELFMEKTAEQNLIKILDQLMDYTHYHFLNEEQLFVESGYYDSAQHKKIHDKFKKEVVSLIDEVKEGKTRVTYKLMTFLNNWLLKHIQEEDQRYAEHVQKYLKHK